MIPRIAGVVGSLFAATAVWYAAFVTQPEIGPLEPSRTTETVAGDLTLTIEGPNEIAAGKLVRLDASKSTATKYVWACVGAKRGDYYVVGDQLFFSSPIPGTYTFFLFGASATDGKVSATKVSHMLTVTGKLPGPGPDPGPGPKPPPGPNIPDGKYKLARVAYDAAMKLPADSRAKAQQVALVFAGIATQMRKAKFDTWVAMKKANGAAFAAAIGDDRKQWGPFMAAVGPAISKLRLATTPWMKKEIVRPDGRIEVEKRTALKAQLDHADAWDEIATGLEAVK